MSAWRSTVLGAVLVVVASSGCQTYAGSKRAAKTGAIMSVGGLAALGLTAACVHSGTGPENACGGLTILFGFAGVTSTAIGVPVALVGVISMGLHTSTSAESRPFSPREHIEKLTADAAEAARDGDCDEVRRLGLAVRNVNSEHYASVFMHDDAIRRCFTP